jgi:predicted amidophosphoribosyltransferase
MKKEKRIKKDEKVLRAFIKVYCQKHHKSVNGLCDECKDLLDYALKRNEKCPLDPKPKCKNCKIHCYKPEYRQKIKEIMKFSGMYYIKRGRIDWVYRYFF